MKVFQTIDGTLEWPDHKYYPLGMEGADEPGIELLEGDYKGLIFRLSDMKMHEDGLQLLYSYDIIKSPEGLDLEGFGEYTQSFVLGIMYNQMEKDEYENSATIGSTP